jgi:5-methylcytosine-specific restriction endonuclease McrA
MEHFRVIQEFTYDEGVDILTKGRHFNLSYESKKHTYSERVCVRLNRKHQSKRIFLQHRECVICGKTIDKWKLEARVGGGGKLTHRFVPYSNDDTLMTTDHIIARALGGGNKDIKNHQVLCNICNSKKGSLEDNIISINDMRSRIYSPAIPDSRKIVLERKIEIAESYLKSYFSQQITHV